MRIFRICTISLCTAQCIHRKNTIEDPGKADNDTPLFRRPAMRNFVVPALAAVCLAGAFAAPAAAAETVTVKVGYSDLNLKTAAGKETLEAGRSPGPGMNGSSEFTCPISLKSTLPSARALRRSSVVSVLQLKL